jgi:ankyrin repeat protein
MTRILLTLGVFLFTVTTAIAGQAPESNKPTKAQIRTAELFIAIRDRDAAATKAALRRGADPNGPNWLGMTPLMWAAMRGNRQIADTLLAKGAKMEAGSIYGTALSFALVGRQEKMALHLLDRGARIETGRMDQVTPLMLAASNGYLPVTQRLLQKQADPNAQDNDGATALLWAARSGQTATADALLKAGANLNAQDSHGRTALMYAATNGQAPMVALLLQRGAAVNLADKSGATALLLAARYSGDPTVLGSLLAHGADSAAKDSRGATPLSLCVARGYDAAAALLRQAGASGAIQPSAAPAPTQIRPAVEKSLTVLQTGMKTFAKGVQCTSCHHQGLGMMALGTAQQRGFAVDKALIGSTLQQMGEEGKRMAPLVHQALQGGDAAKLAPAVDIGDNAIATGYMMGGLIANGIPANPGLAETALFLATQQKADGHWEYGFERGHMQSSFVITTALALNVLRAYGPKEPPEKLAAAFARAKQWLLHTPMTNSEDRAARLLGLFWAGASVEERQQSLQALLAAQRADGGWSCAPPAASDAFVTGLALYALHVGGGMPTDDAAYQRGVAYLLRTQDEDGSWYVNKRTNPANTYFDAGFPHGESQFTSFAATCWATMALVQVDCPPQTASR